MTGKQFYFMGYIRVRLSGNVEVLTLLSGVRVNIGSTNHKRIESRQGNAR
jgi:hypothetical protein